MHTLFVRLKVCLFLSVRFVANAFACAFRILNYLKARSHLPIRFVAPRPSLLVSQLSLRLFRASFCLLLVLLSAYLISHVRRMQLKQLYKYSIQTHICLYLFLFVCIYIYVPQYLRHRFQHKCQTNPRRSISVLW